MTFKLQPQNKIVLVRKENDQLGIYKNDGSYINIKKDLFEEIGIKVPMIEHLEELPDEHLYITELVIITKDAYNDHGDKGYEIGFYRIDINTGDKYKQFKYFSKIKPQALSEKYYLYQDENNKLSLITKIGYSEVKLEEEIIKQLPETLKNYTIKIGDMKIPNNANIQELILGFGTVETLHILLKIDNHVKVLNTFYPESIQGEELKVSETSANNTYFTLDEFSTLLANHPIIKTIELKIKENEERQELTTRHIRKRVLENIKNNCHKD